MDLRRSALALLLVTGAHAADDDLVDVGVMDPTLKLDIRYATADNFLKRKVYDAPRALLRRAVAERLVKVQASLRKRGLSLKIWDAYRPHPVQFEMWKLVPDENYVADPKKGSLHNRGAAVDVTIVDAAGKELDMGTAFDDFSPKAHPEAPDVSPEAKKNRKLLKDAMTAEGFEQLKSEWWHFNGPGAKTYPLASQPLSSVTSK